MDDEISPVLNDTLSPRFQALKSFSARMRREIRVGSLIWDESDLDVRALTINNCMRRQRDAIEGAIALGDARQGHLAVAFVRAFLEERMWVTFLASMTHSEANGLLLVMGRWDARRALIAQRDYIGDLDMTLHLWFPPGFVDAHAATLDDVKNELRQLRGRWGWQGILPSAKWVAEQTSLLEEYEYLHSATSRALHFSAGEVLRRGWGVPGGALVTDKDEFREHLAEFAYDQLWRQHIGTIIGAADFLGDASISVPDDFFSEENRIKLISELTNLGRVPLVHAHEWNLAPPASGTRIAWAAVTLAQSADAGLDEASETGSQ
ncbi:hypothetical protein [Streptomyces sp. NBC_00620]|uniref:hypothetical protein n=1 Tax=Streptomyces sp. NBC_00620 TaxID=2903666 RepID=UPI00224F2CE0|nr:hypothetical protein [Streptomyces sp. NBC_00620]MCX4976473.1 hypothetical protein [Streptomyces sp. NBC_00620]